MITVANGSAGGNTAALVGVTNGAPRFEADGEHRDVSRGPVNDLPGEIMLTRGLWEHARFKL